MKPQTHPSDDYKLIWMMDSSGKIIYASPSFEALCGYSPDECLELPVDALFDPQSYHKINDILSRTLSDIETGNVITPTLNVALGFTCKDGSIYNTKTLINTSINENQTFDCLIGLSRDPQQPDLSEIEALLTLQSAMIGAVKSYTDKLRELEGLDPLTGTFSRQEINRIGVREFNRYKRYQSVFSICLLDIDHVAKITERYGANTRDRVIKVVADICRASLRNQDVFGRLDESELLLILPETDINGAALVAARLRETVSRLPFDVEGRTFNASVSISVASSTRVDSWESTLERANEGLSTARQYGGNQVQVVTANG